MRCWSLWLFVECSLSWCDGFVELFVSGGVDGCERFGGSGISGGEGIGGWGCCGLWFVVVEGVDGWFECYDINVCDGVEKGYCGGCI